MIAAFTRSRFFRRFGPRMMPPLERAWAKASGGGRPLSGLLVPSLVLHTTGARSGLERSTELMYCPESNGRMLVTGSNFAREGHPAWTSNLIAHPDAAVTVKGRRVPVHATRIPDDRLDETWAYIEKQWPGYRGYERASGRTLRIFRLTPEGS
ncbi:MAG: nitroreductase family deazaflavin-dependent oxidoreductase [Glaciihabitans sp.]|nr:nitroreductase family deazaflavin-dependent oxidoreductase [Glaciihabitans sp.]